MRSISPGWYSWDRLKRILKENKIQNRDIYTTIQQKPWRDLTSKWSLYTKRQLNCHNTRAHVRIHTILEEKQIKVYPQKIGNFLTIIPLSFNEFFFFNWFYFYQKAQRIQSAIDFLRNCQSKSRKRLFARRRPSRGADVILRNKKPPHPALWLTRSASLTFRSFRIGCS